MDDGGSGGSQKVNKSSRKETVRGTNQDDEEALEGMDIDEQATSGTGDVDESNISARNGKASAMGYGRECDNIGRYDVDDGSAMDTDSGDQDMAGSESDSEDNAYQPGLNLVSPSGDKGSFGCRSYVLAILYLLYSCIYQLLIVTGAIIPLPSSSRYVTGWRLCDTQIISLEVS
jgi:hypothetical protein